MLGWVNLARIYKEEIGTYLWIAGKEGVVCGGMGNGAAQEGACGRRVRCVGVRLEKRVHGARLDKSGTQRGRWAV